MFSVASVGASSSRVCCSCCCACASWIIIVHAGGIATSIPINIMAKAMKNDANAVVVFMLFIFMN
jgi:hypothetical protein